MKVELEKTFPMPVSTDTAWEFLQNIQGVAGCVPGARITERVNATHFRGTIVVRMGPASLSFKGEIEVRELDPTRRTLRLIGKGSDSSGTSAASMDLTARIEPGTDVTSSALIGKSEVSMSGKAAAFGGRMMTTVADQILKQFAANFAIEARKLAASAGAQANGAQANTSQANVAKVDAAAHAKRNADTPPGASAPASESSQSASAKSLARSSAIRAQTPSSSNAAIEGNAQAPSQGSVAPANGAQVPLSRNSLPATFGKRNEVLTDSTSAAPANELNVLSLAWAIVRDWIRGVFKRGPA